MEENLKSVFRQKASIDKRPFTQAIFVGIALVLLGWGAPAHAQNLISNGGFDNGLTDWTQASWAGGSSFGTNANGPTDTSAASGNYAYAGGGAYNVLQQDISGVTSGGVYRLTFQAGSQSGEASALGNLSLYDGQAGDYNSAGFKYQPSPAAFGTYTVDFTARAATALWLRNDGGGYAAYDNVSVTQIGSVAHALNYSAASGYSEIGTGLSGSGKVTVNAGTGGLTLWGTSTYSGGTEVNGGTLFILGAGTLGDATGGITIRNTDSTATLDLRNAQTRTGTITMIGQGARLVSGGGSGSLINNGNALEFGGGQISVSVSGTGGLNVTGGGSITSANSYTGATTISGTTGWYGQNKLLLSNANALGAASGDLTISGGTVSLENNTITRSGIITMTGQYTKIISNGGGSIVNNGGAFQFGGGSLEVPLSGTGGLNVNGGGQITSANSFTGDTTISATPGWFNTNTFFVGNDTALGSAAAGLTISGGTVSLMDNTITRSGNVSITGGNVHTGTISKSGGDYDIRGGKIDAVLAGDVGLVKTGNETATLNAPTYTSTTSVNTGALVISRNSLTATILPNSVLVNFPSTPAAGTYNILSGPLASASLSSPTVTVAGGNLPSGLTATVINSPNLRVVVQSTQTAQETYLASFGLSGANLLGTADPDGDGMDNNAEFAFGTSPISGASRATTLTSGTGEIILTYLQRKTGVTYTVKSLPNLTTPFDSGTPVTPSLSANQGNLPSDDYERYEAKLRTDSPLGFLQVKAVAP
jgi:hypothetical protein